MSGCSKRGRFLALAGLVGLLPAAVGCRALSEGVMQPEAGLNGGFETSEQGLPVNWLLYTPATVPDADFTLGLESRQPAEGTQCLAFVVTRCGAEGGWRSPGCAIERPARKGGRYRISLMVQNTGCRAHLKVGGVSAFKNQLQTLALPTTTGDTWATVQHETTLPDNMQTLRLELNLLSPGTFRLDGVRIEELEP